MSKHETVVPLDSHHRFTHAAGVARQWLMRIVNVGGVIALVAAVAMATWQWTNKHGSRGKADPNLQAAATSLGLPRDGEIDHRFTWPSPWLTASIPEARRFDSPLGSEQGALTYNAQPYHDMNEKRGGFHFGDDLNGIGGMNTDLGDPVCATADGLVLYTGQPARGWGNVVIIGHTAPDGRPLQSMYAHLETITVKTGALVARGARIGSVGTANGCYPAHLHFELSITETVDVGPGYGMTTCHRLDPIATVTAWRNAAADDLTPSPLARAAR